MDEAGDRLGRAARSEEPAAWRRVHKRVRQAASPFRRQLAEEWEDAVQEAEIALLEALRNDRFRWESSFSTFSWRVTSNICVDRLRRRKVRAAEPLDEAPPPQAPREASPENRLARAERLTAIFRVLMAMPAECRRLWRMILDGQSYDEMSRTVGVSAGTLRVRVHRCRQRAREALADLERGVPWE